MLGKEIANFVFIFAFAFAFTFSATFARLRLAMAVFTLLALFAFSVLPVSAGELLSAVLFFGWTGGCYRIWHPTPVGGAQGSGLRFPVEPVAL